MSVLTLHNLQPDVSSPASKQAVSPRETETSAATPELRPSAQVLNSDLPFHRAEARVSKSLDYPPGLGLPKTAPNTSSDRPAEALSAPAQPGEKAFVCTIDFPSPSSSPFTSALQTSVDEIPYFGQWLPADCDGCLTASRVLPSLQPRTAIPQRGSGPEGALCAVSTVQSALLGALSSLVIAAHADSGCSGSLTPIRSALVNTRPCSDRFKAADGLVYPASLIGDMPVVAKDSRGRRRQLLLRNVRFVPGFKYTLLSVRQLWHEQRIDARFADVNALVYTTAGGEVRLPFTSTGSLPVVHFLSSASSAAARPDSAWTIEQLAQHDGPPYPIDDPRWNDAVASGLKGADLEKVNARRAELGKPPYDVRAETTTSLPGGAASPPGSALSGKLATASTRPLGFHRVGTSAHIARLPASQAAEVMQRRSMLGVDKLRATAHTTTDAPRNLASASAVPPNPAIASARIRRAPHSTTLSAPAPEPGVLHIDIKELVLSHGGFRYVVFAIDEHSRFVFIEYIKLKSEVGDAVKRIVAAFDATVGTPVDDAGRALPRPRAREIHSDREGKLMSHDFLDFRAKASLHHTTSPPHDHDLNPIAERVIGLISETACAVRAASGAPASFWPWIIAYVVDWHNATVGSVGSSTADAAISPHQRFTHRAPRVMDLATFGCRAVVLKPPTHQHKPSLSTRGWVGMFLGRSRYSKGAYDVLVGRSIVTSSSVVVDEEYLPWAPGGEQRHPLTAVSHAPSQPQHAPLSTEQAPASSAASAPATFDRRLCFLDLMSGPYARSDGLTAELKACGWAQTDMIDNDGETGGGWQHDLMNDSAYAQLLAYARDGKYDGIHIGFPCSTGALSRLFNAIFGRGGDRGPPMVRDADNPDGLPEEKLDPKHIRELRVSNQLLERTVELAIAARRSSARTRITFEQPADRSVKGSIAYAPDLAHHGSILATQAVRRLVDELGMKSCTFAYCRLGSRNQKYTTILYTPELGEVLDSLNEPRYQCNHERGWHVGVRGREADGSFASKRAAAYPVELCRILARAFTRACTGSDSVPAAASGTRAAADPASETIVDRDLRPAAELPVAQPAPSSPAGGVSAGGEAELPLAAAEPRVPASAALAETRCLGLPTLTVTSCGRCRSAWAASCTRPPRLAPTSPSRSSTSAAACIAPRPSSSPRPTTCSRTSRVILRPASRTRAPLRVSAATPTRRGRRPPRLRGGSCSGRARLSTGARASSSASRCLRARPRSSRCPREPRTWCTSASSSPDSVRQNPALRLSPRTRRARATSRTTRSITIA